MKGGNLLWCMGAYKAKQQQPVITVLRDVRENSEMTPTCSGVYAQVFSTLSSPTSNLVHTLRSQLLTARVTDP